MARSNLQRYGLVGLAATIIVAVVAAFVATGSGDDSTETQASTTTRPELTAPLTGKPVADDDLLDRPALVVKVDNTPRGLGVQEGLDKADIVFVEKVEEGVTRLAAVFHSQNAEVGPVRSARTSDLSIGALLRSPLFVYSGANKGVTEQIRESPRLVDMGIDANEDVTDVYQSHQRDKGLLRYFLPTEDLYEVAPEDGGEAPEPLFDYRRAGDEAAGTPVNKVEVGYGGQVATHVGYEWSGKGWARTQNGERHVMADDGTQIAPANVVVLFVPYEESDYVDTTGAVSPEAVLEGEGEAWFFSNGRVVEGKWSRPGPEAQMEFTGAAGEDVLLTPGTTWIELAPSKDEARFN